MVTFIDVKKAYVNAREDERRTIIEHLNCHGFKNTKGLQLSKRGGSGIKKYTSGGLIDAFDLSNWKYIEAVKGDKYFFISLQSFDKDPHSGNHHVLMDRIGLFIRNVKEKYDPERIFNEMVSTNIELPMNKEKLAKLINILESNK